MRSTCAGADGENAALRSKRARPSRRRDRQAGAARGCAAGAATNRRRPSWKRRSLRRRSRSGSTGPGTTYVASQPEQDRARERGPRITQL